MQENAECRMQENAECRMQNAECRMNGTTILGMGAAC